MANVQFLIGLLLAAAQDTAPVALDGFQVEELYAGSREEGSWICMAFDPQGRITVACEKGPLRRITLGSTIKVELLDERIRFAMGLLYEFGALYANGDGPQGVGLYRLRDRDGDGKFEELKLLRTWESNMVDHGPHAIVRGPDDLLYMVNGNYVRDPQGMSARSPYRNTAEDLLLPRLWDSVGHAVDYIRLRAPGGQVIRTDPEGKEWELLTGGLRNPYDIAFNPDGELFTFDSDMDWDQGLPWYRPNRILHCVSGGEFGWRTGSGKWPVAYPDSLPPVVDIGLASPTGIAFGTRAKFPARYRRALFASDWAYGRIVAVHLAPKGASYTATFEDFVKGKPLQVTDVEFGPDGAMYFVTGGRGTQSKLYRITFKGTGEETPAPRDDAAAEARALRRRIEAFHGRRDPGALEAAWPYLRSADRWIRSAARIAIEHQDPSLWRERALAEKQPAASLSALLALIRTGAKELKAPILDALDRLDWPTLPEDLRHELLRLYGLTFVRLGPSDSAEKARVIRRLDSLYPSGSVLIDRELGALLVHLGAPSIVEKTVALLQRAESQEDQIHLAMLLRLARVGWTPERRRAYLGWFERASRFRGGTSVPAFVRTILADALLTLTEKERIDLEPEIRELSKRPAQSIKEPGLIVKAWTMEDLLPEVEKKLEKRHFQRGQAAFVRANCLACHRFRGEGGATGPDITAASSRFSRRDLLETIVVPSKVVSDQYQNTLFQTSDDVVVGRIVKEEGGKLHILTNPLHETVVVLEKKSIRASKPAALSPMPEGLLNILEKDQILDLIAYIESGGDPAHPLFRR